MSNFDEALAEARRQAARRRPADDRFVFLWLSPDPRPHGAWHIAEEPEMIPNRLNCLTEGILLVYADGQIGIGSHGPPSPPAVDRNALLTLIDRQTDLGIDDPGAFAQSAEHQRDALIAFVKEIRDDWDHDSDAHRYGTTCRVCEAEKLIGPAPK